MTGLLPRRIIDRRLICDKPNPSLTPTAQAHLITASMKPNKCSDDVMRIEATTEKIAEIENKPTWFGLRFLNAANLCNW